ncbi:hypothetical protein [Chamaesiphon polymorphus]|uniref:CHASE2 domain-containing protein n=1 Tax=Chamaesiphon polymorphus CCALA 037 TaxID=2107692 RepID=A0A2T1GCI0_9CYAN|nr:hypothetical protein [Chamaesiphon polymorphus]PSB55076.1 hypothetical protein C7B77_16160 [Chamaesiphon polymorphus CCALA 037]
MDSIEIIIKLGTGSIEDGFNTVNIDLKYAGTTHWENRSYLPPNPQLKQLLNEWQTLYPHVIRLSGDLNFLAPTFEAVTVRNVSSHDIKEINDRFAVVINDWLNSGDFGENVNKLRSDLAPRDRILVIIVSERADIWRLPWHYWNFITDRTHAVEVFCKPRNTKLSATKPQCNGKVNTLGLIGQDPQLNLNLDFLKTLPQASPPKILKTISAYDVGNALNCDLPWDIFIFNGHGDTLEDAATQTGIIYLDNDTPLEISRLKIEIKKAVNRGLQIAIFNCCSGLGLAEQLSDVNIPYIIVMREKIPNLVAQQFLQDLLDRYSRGNSFPAAFKYARERLILSEGGFASVADWLPILFYNPLSNHVTWRDLSTTPLRAWTPLRVRAFCRDLIHPKYRIWKTVGISFIVSAILLKLQPTLLAKVPIEANIIDYIQTTTEAAISPQPSQVAIVNYDRAYFFGNTLNDDSELIEMVEKVERTTKQVTWGIDLNISNNPTIFDRSNVVNRCNNHANTTNADDPEPSSCDRQSSIEALLKRSKLLPSGQHNLTWNSNLLTKNSLSRISAKIDRVNFSDIAKLSPSEIKKLFDSKIVLVGITNEKEIAPFMRKAIELDRIIRANRPQNPLPLLGNRSIGLEFIWIFLWSVLAGIIMWQRQLFLPLAIGGQIAIAVLFLIFGQIVPIFITSIGILLVGGVIYTIEHLSLDRAA